MARRNNEIDWEAVERAYRSGTFSLREIARRYTCTESAIRYRAKTFGWQRDLSKDVRRATNAKLLRSNLRTPNARDDAGIIDQASTFRVDVVTSHRADIQQLHGLKRVLAGRLSDVLHGGSPDGPCLGEKESAGDLLEKLSRVTARLIPLERQAFNLDAGTDDEGGVKIVISPDDAAL